MSQFSGPQGKGAMRRRKEVKREQAEDRQRRAILAVHPDGNCDCPPKSDRHTVLVIDKE